MFWCGHACQPPRRTIEEWQLGFRGLRGYAEADGGQVRLSQGQQDKINESPAGLRPQSAPNSRARQHIEQGVDNFYGSVQTPRNKVNNIEVFQPSGSCSKSEDIWRPFMDHRRVQIREDEETPAAAKCLSTEQGKEVGGTTTPTNKTDEKSSAIPKGGSSVRYSSAMSQPHSGFVTVRLESGQTLFSSPCACGAWFSSPVSSGTRGARTADEKDVDDRQNRNINKLRVDSMSPLLRRRLHFDFEEDDNENTAGAPNPNEKNDKVSGTYEFRKEGMPVPLEWREPLLFPHQDIKLINFDGQEAGKQHGHQKLQFLTGVNRNIASLLDTRGLKLFSSALKEGAGKTVEEKATLQQNAEMQFYEELQHEQNYLSALNRVANHPRVYQQNKLKNLWLGRALSQTCVIPHTATKDENRLVVDRKAGLVPHVHARWDLDQHRPEEGIFILPQSSPPPSVRKRSRIEQPGARSTTPAAPAQETMVARPATCGDPGALTSAKNVIPSSDTQLLRKKFPARIRIQTTPRPAKDISAAIFELGMIDANRLGLLDPNEQEDFFPNCENHEPAKNRNDSENRHSPPPPTRRANSEALADAERARRREYRAETFEGKALMQRKNVLIKTVGPAKLTRLLPRNRGTNKTVASLTRRTPGDIKKEESTLEVNNMNAGGGNVSPRRIGPRPDPPLHLELAHPKKPSYRHPDVLKEADNRRERKKQELLKRKAQKNQQNDRDLIAKYGAVEKTFANKLLERSRPINSTSTCPPETQAR